MGAQAAALLDADGPVGDVPAPRPARGSLRLRGPEPYDLDRVARAHGGVGLAPKAWDGERLHLHDVVVDRDLRVQWSGEAWCDPALPDAQVQRELAALPGIGPFAAAQLLPLLAVTARRGRAVP